jgi:hypothetical protein
MGVFCVGRIDSPLLSDCAGEDDFRLATVRAHVVALQSSPGAHRSYHWYVIKPESGKKAEHTAVVGSLGAFPSEKDAWREIDRRRLKPQLDQSAIATGRSTFGDAGFAARIADRSIGDRDRENGSR